MARIISPPPSNKWQTLCPTTNSWETHSKTLPTLQVEFTHNLLQLCIARHLLIIEDSSLCSNFNHNNNSSSRLDSNSSPPKTSRLSSSSMFSRCFRTETAKVYPTMQLNKATLGSSSNQVPWCQAQGDSNIMFRTNKKRAITCRWWTCELHCKVTTGLPRSSSSSLATQQIPQQMKTSRSL